MTSSTWPYVGKVLTLTAELVIWVGLLPGLKDELRVIKIFSDGRGTYGKKCLPTRVLWCRLSVERVTRSGLVPEYPEHGAMSRRV